MRRNSSTAKHNAEEREFVCDVKKRGEKCFFFASRRAKETRRSRPSEAMEKSQKFISTFHADLDGMITQKTKIERSLTDESEKFRNITQTNNQNYAALFALWETEKLAMGIIYTRNEFLIIGRVGELLQEHCWVGCLIGCKAFFLLYFSFHSSSLPCYFDSQIE